MNYTLKPVHANVLFFKKHEQRPALYMKLESTIYLMNELHTNFEKFIKLKTCKQYIKQNMHTYFMK